MVYRCFTLVALLAASTPAWAEPRGGAAAVDALFQEIADPAGPGCAMSVAQNGDAVFERAFGLANLEQPTASPPLLAECCMDTAASVVVCFLGCQQHGNQ